MKLTKRKGKALIRNECWKEFEESTKEKNINIKQSFFCGFNMAYNLLRKEKIKAERKLVSPILTDFCIVCGSSDKTLHHLRTEEIKSKKNKGKLNGIIVLCRTCHDIVEDIVNKGKAKKLWYNKGYEDGKNCKNF